MSFTFQNNEAVTIENLCAHLMKDEKIKTEHFNVRVKDKSAASNGEGRTFFGGVLTITMDVWNADENEVRAFWIPLIMVSRAAMLTARVLSADAHAQHQREDVRVQGLGLSEAPQGAVQRLHGQSAPPPLPVSVFMRLSCPLHFCGWWQSDDRLFSVNTVRFSASSTRFLAESTRWTT